MPCGEGAAQMGRVQGWGLGPVAIAARAGSVAKAAYQQNCNTHSNAAGEECNVVEGQPACAVPTTADVSPGPDTNGTDTGAPSPAPDTNTTETPAACEPNTCVNSTTWCGFDQVEVPCDEGGSQRMWTGRATAAMRECCAVNHAVNRLGLGQMALHTRCSRCTSWAMCMCMAAAAAGAGAGTVTAAVFKHPPSCVFPICCPPGEECNVQEGKPACSMPTTSTVSPAAEPACVANTCVDDANVCASGKVEPCAEGKLHCLGVIGWQAL